MVRLNFYPKYIVRKSVHWTLTVCCQKIVDSISVSFIVVCSSFLTHLLEEDKFTCVGISSIKSQTWQQLVWRIDVCRARKMIGYVLVHCFLQLLPRPVEEGRGALIKLFWNRRPTPCQSPLNFAHLVMHPLCAYFGKDDGFRLCHGA